ncbi:c-type cytochrome [Rhizosphaericola mali]|nr:c-type cytochrome [Rhizosphaericola mali]
MNNFIKNKRQTVLLGVFVFGLLVITASYKNATPPGFKNLKVLPTTISRDSLHDLMEGYSAALGVKCGYCHAKSSSDPKRLDFASDDVIQKTYARHMITMTQNINKNEFNFEKSNRPDTINIVTCGTCHRGNKDPEAFVAPEKD